MKIHISPKMIALMVQNAQSSEAIQAVYDLVKDSAHTYQLGWIMEQKIKAELRERQEQQQSQQQQETKKKDHWEDYLKGDFNCAIKIRQETKK